MIRDGCVLVDGAAQKTGYKLKGGEQITARIPPREETSVEPEDIPLNIIYEDEYLAVIDKPAGIVTHPGPGNETGTLVNALLARYPELAEMMDDPDVGERLGIVHRLDRGTSGLLVAARDKPSLLALMAQFQARTVDKIYLTLLEKRPASNTGHRSTRPSPAIHGSANVWRSIGAMASRRRPNLKCWTMTSRATARWLSSSC